MRGLSRRQALCGAVSAGASYSLGTGCACAQTLLGCYPADPDDLLQHTQDGFAFARNSASIQPGSGDADLDRALQYALTTLRTVFAVTPGFGFIDDSRFGPDGNAGATAKRLMPEGVDGTIVFGRGMLSNLMKVADPGAAIVAVCAHEFGHILAYRLSLHDQLVPHGSQPLRGEQYADYMAGFFAGQRKLLTPTYPAIKFLETLGAMAGGHHGTKEQREEAVYEGYKDAHDNKLTMSQGAHRGFDWASKRPVA